VKKKTLTPPLPLPYRGGESSAMSKKYLNIEHYKQDKASFR